MNTETVSDQNEPMIVEICTRLLAIVGVAVPFKSAVVSIVGVAVKVVGPIVDCTIEVSKAGTSIVDVTCSVTVDDIKRFSDELVASDAPMLEDVADVVVRAVVKAVVVVNIGADVVDEKGVIVVDTGAVMFRLMVTIKPAKRFELSVE